MLRSVNRSNMSQSDIDTAPERIFRKPDAGARRLRLREFQAQLVERMQAARTGTNVQTNQLGVMIGPNRWLINLQEAGEIVAVGAITKVPLTHSWFLGLTNIRGNLISVVDLAQFQGHAPAAIDKESRIVAFGPSLAFNSALLVSRVMGLRNVADMTLQDRPDGVAAWATRCYVDRDTNVWNELDLSTIIQDSQFLQASS